MLATRVSRLAAVSLLIAVAVLSAAADVDVAISRRLSESALNGRAFDDVRDLTETIGSRLTGSAAYRRAARWAADRFRDAGVAAVQLEPFTIPRAWERAAPALAEIVSPMRQPIAVQALGWSPSTPDRGVEGELVLADAATRGDRVRNRMVLMTDGGGRDRDVELARAGALALLFPDDDPNNEIAARVRQYGGEIAALPSAVVARGDATRLRRLVAQGPVRVAMTLRHTISAGPVTVENVIAELRGRERPDEWVLVGAHLDSWDLGPGAQDNAAGVAMVLEAARAIAALDRRPRRSIRFALWGGEEQGLLGSSAYAATHGHELNDAVAVLNADGGTGRILGWTTPGREDVMAKLRELATGVLTDLGSASVDRSMRYAFDSDGGPFIRQGVPVLDLNVDDSRYEEIHHKVADTLDRVNARNLAVGAATVAVTAYAIADAVDRIAKRGPRLAPR